MMASSEEAPQGRGRRAGSMIVLASTAAAAGLYFGKDLFVPIALALLFTALLRPIVGALGRFRIPAPAVATALVLAILALIGTGVFMLAQPVQDWVAEAPKTFAAARGKIDKLRRPVQQVSQAVEKVQQEVAGGAKGGKPAAPAPAQGSSPAGTGVLAHLFGTTTAFLSGFLETLVLVFLLLATGTLFHRKVAALMPSPVKGTADEAVEEAESVVRHYLVVTAIINIGQGVAVGLVMKLIGMPNPVLWGMLTFVLEFLPYLGGFLMIGFLTIAAFATFDTVGKVLLAPGAYLAITTIQNNVVSPFAYGNRLQLNPVVVLISTLAGYFLWGVAGAFMAIPALAAIKVVAERLRPGSRLATVLGE
jgi:predicted PurR-regulated permease PerM